MAITEIIEAKEGVGGGWNIQGGRRFSIKMHVHSDDREDGPQLMIESLGLNVGDTYRYPLTRTATETNARLFLQDISLDRVVWIGKTGQRGDVTVQFGPYDASKDAGPLGEDGYRDPFAAPPVVRGYGEPDEDESVLTDRDGDPVVNSAGDPLDPGVTRPRSTLVLEVSRVERMFPLTRVAEFKDHVNASEWLGYPARCVLCQDIQPVRRWDEEVNGWVWDVAYKFAYRPPFTVDEDGVPVTYPGWARRVLDAGLRQRSMGTRVPIVQGNAPVSSPVMLKPDGTAAGEADEPHYLIFDVMLEADFGELNFPTDTFSAGTPEPPPPEEPEDP